MQKVQRRVIDEIARAGGWIPFARYMELVLHEPGLGYYAAGAAKFGAEGDFVTAPGISSLFGATLSTQIGEVLAQTGGEVLELGAGSGTLAADLLEAMRDRGELPARYLILEISPDLLHRQRATLQTRVPGLLDRVEWIGALPQGFTGVILANEVLDALPVHAIAWRADGPRERGVIFDNGRFHWDERPLAAGPLREAAQGLAMQPPYCSEISLAAPALVRSLADCLRRGMLLFIDYGFGRREFYHPQRSTGTLMCHYRHRAHDDPFFLPGLQDITAHVDFTAVAEAGIDAGLGVAGYTTQAHFLVNAGITRLLERNSQAAPMSYLPHAAAAQKLLSPAEMGELFKVIGLDRGVAAKPSGFGSGDKSRLL